MTNLYEYWRAALAGEKPKAFVDDPRLGFYRKGVYARNDKGNRKRVGWQPVAIFMDGGTMTARVGSESTGDDVTGDKLNELWSYCCDNPISEGTYREVAKLGRDWPDAHDPSKNRAIKSIALEAGKEPVIALDDAESPEQKLAREIAEAKAGLSQYTRIESDEQAGGARSLQNELIGLKGEANKLHKAEKEPHLEAGRIVDRKWFPLRDDADAAALTLRRAMEGWEDFKREQARKAQAEADRIEREHAEAVRKAEAANAPPPPPPKPVAPNAPAPSAQITAATGRKASVKVAKVVVKIDLQKAWEQFGGQPEVYELFMALAQKAVNAGLNVAGAEIEERSVVR